MDIEDSLHQGHDAPPCRWTPSRRRWSRASAGSLARRGAVRTALVDEGLASPRVAVSWQFSARRASSSRPTRSSARWMGCCSAAITCSERISSNAIAHWPIDDREPEDAAAAPDRRRALIESIGWMRRTTRLRNCHWYCPDTGGHSLITATSLSAGFTPMHELHARRILDTMNGAASAAELGHGLWPDVPGFDAYLVLSEVLGHLELLEESGNVRGLETGGLVRWERISPMRGVPIASTSSLRSGRGGETGAWTPHRATSPSSRAARPRPRRPTADPGASTTGTSDLPALAIANTPPASHRRSRRCRQPCRRSGSRQINFEHASLKGDEPFTILIVEHRRKLSKRVQLQVGSRTLLVGN